MEDTLSHDFTQRPLAVVVGDADCLSADFVEKLLANILRVNIFSENENKWKLALKNVSTTAPLNIFKNDDSDLLENASYYIYFSKYYSSDFESILEIYKEDKKTIDDSFEKYSDFIDKSIYVFDVSMLSFKKEIEDFIGRLYKGIDKSYAIYFVGSPIGTRLSPKSLSAIDNVILSAVEKKKITINNNSYFYPIYTPTLSKELIKRLFSFSSKGRNGVILGSRIPEASIAAYIKRYLPEVEVFEGGLEAYDPTNYLGINYIKSDIKTGVKESLNWLEKQKRIFPKIFDEEHSEANKQVKKEKKAVAIGAVIESSIGKAAELSKGIHIPKINVKLDFLPEIRKKITKNLIKFKSQLQVSLFFLILFVIFVATPYVLTGISFTSFVVGQKIALRGDFKNSTRAFNLSTSLARVTNLQLGVYERFTSANLFSTLNQYSLMLEKLGEVLKRSSRTATFASELAQKIMANKDYDVNFYINNLSLDLDYLYVQTGFLHSEVDALKGPGSKLVKKEFYKIDFEDLREKVKNAKEITDQLPILLGVKKEKVYLILLQNDSELRPTGGFIGSFAIVKIDGGKMTDLTVHDIYDADGQLRGYVKPPDPLSRYLRVDSWYMRDSNWDPDFATSAGRAEWFLDKELNIKVDGVIGVNLQAVKKLVGGIGSLYLPDSEKTLNENNFYEITQYEAEKDFTPGSRNKVNILSAITDALAKRLVEGDTNYIAIARSVYSSLETKDIQLFVHQGSIQEKLNELGWSGSVKAQKCELENCYQDFLAVVEANLGSNKSNYYIKRSAELSLSIDKDKLKRNLSIKFTNDSPETIGGKGVYKNYLRLFVPIDSSFDDVKIVSAGGYEETSPTLEISNDRLESGVYFEITSGEEKTLIMSWKSADNVDIKRNGEYNLSLIKQSGVTDIPYNMSLLLPDRFSSTQSPAFSLTKGGSYSYNTNLVSDQNIKIYW